MNKSNVSCDFLQHFAAGTAVQGTAGVSNNLTGEVTPYTEGNGLSAEMQTYYSDYLIDNAEPYLVHDLFAQKHRVPRGAKTISFRKYDPLPKRTTPITEGVTPDGQNLRVSVVEGTLAQYGGYVELTDLLLLTAVDNNLCMATKLLGAQAGRTLDTITREVLAGGTNVQYADGTAWARHALMGGNTGETVNHYLTVDCIRRAVRFLKSQNAERIGGSYVAIIHPDVAYDLMNDPAWKYPNQYADATNIFEGEIGKIEGVRFIETSEAKIFHAPDLSPTSRTLIATGSAMDGKLPFYNDGSIKAGDLVGRWVIANGIDMYVGANSEGDMTLYTDSTMSQPSIIMATEGTVLFPGEAGAGGRDVYATLIMGDNAYGTTQSAGEGLQHIVKQLGSAGTSDPLNQRATVGWKANKVTVRLVEAFMVRVETTSTFESGAN